MDRNSTDSIKKIIKGNVPQNLTLIINTLPILFGFINHLQEFITIMRRFIWHIRCRARKLGWR